MEFRSQMMSAFVLVQAHIGMLSIFNTVASCYDVIFYTTSIVSMFLSRYLKKAESRENSR